MLRLTTMRSSRQLVVFLAAIANLFLADSGYAQALCDGTRNWSELKSDQKQLSSWLETRKFAALDGALQRRQTQYEEGQYREEDLSWSFDTFMQDKVAWTPLIQEWISTYPHSYAARLALGIHRIGLGYAARGGKFRDETSDEQFAALHQILEIAAEDMRLSTTLTAKPIVSLAYQMTIEKAMGTRKSLDALLTSALKVAPESIMVRAQYAAAISPKWLGSFASLTGFEKTIRSGQLSDGEKRYLTFVIEQERAMGYWAAKDYDTAARHYRAASQLCTLSWPWRHQANMFNEAERWSDALDALDRYLELEPGEAWAIRRKGYANQQLGQMTKAITSYKDAAELGDSYAQNAYGWYCFEGKHMPQDLDAAIRWFRAAVQQGDENARVNLRTALEAKSK